MNPDLSRFTDDEIASEYHWRMMRALGDQRVGVTSNAAGLAPHPPQCDAIDPFNVIAGIVWQRP